MFSFYTSILGWIGMVIITTSFYFLSSGKLNARSLYYQTIQCTGCSFIALDTFTKGAYAVMILQIISLLISFKTIKSVIDNKIEKLEKINE